MKKISIFILFVFAAAAIADTPTVSVLFSSVSVGATGQTSAAKWAQTNIPGQGDFGLSVDISQTTSPVIPPSLQLDYYYANAPGDVHTVPSSIAGTTFTTSQTFSTTHTISDFYPAPANSLNITATNLSTQPAEITIKLFHPQPSR